MDLKQIEIIHYEGRNRLKKNEQHLKGIWDNMIGNYKCLIEILEEKEIENWWRRYLSNGWNSPNFMKGTTYKSLRNPENPKQKHKKKTTCKHIINTFLKGKNKVLKVNRESGETMQGTNKTYYSWFLICKVEAKRQWNGIF